MSIRINLDKAKEVWKNKLRKDRAPLLAELDVQFMRAIESGNTSLQQEIVKKKQHLRDITVFVDMAVDIDEVKSISI